MNTQTEEITNHAQVDLSKITSLKSPGHREDFLRELFCQLVTEAGSMMKSVKPLHEKLQAFCIKHEKDSRGILYEQIYGVFVFTKVQCEFYGKGIIRALKFAGDNLKLPYDDSHCEDTYTSTLNHFYYIKTVGDSILHAEKILGHIEATFEPKGQPQKTHSVLSDSFRDQTLTFYFQRAFHCAGLCLWEHLKEQKMILALKDDVYSIRKVEAFRDIRKSFDTLKDTNEYTVGYLKGLRKRAETELRKMDHGKKPDSGNMMERRWPKDFTQCLKEYNERAQKMRFIHEAVSLRSENSRSRHIKARHK